MTNFRFVVTGSPGAGKTTVLEALTKRGYKYVTESARAIIKKRIQDGLSPRPPLEQFAWEMLTMDIELYEKTPVSDEPVFFDRGVVDALGFVAEQGALSPVEIAAQMASFPYNDIVFMFPPWEAIYCTDAERDQSFPEARQVYERLVHWYKKWEYKPVEVPKVDIDARIDFILQTINHALGRTKNK